MLVFIDESGDPGLKIDKGSSYYFIVSLVVFKENEEAVACDKKIELLKKELNWNNLSEFHFKNNSNKIKELFLRTVNEYNFFYYCIVINKDLNKLWSKNFNKKYFYNRTCSLVFEKAKDKLDNAIVLIDKSGNLDFRHQLEKYLKSKINSSKKKYIKKIKMQDSAKNNLLQLADYVAGSINRSINKTKKCNNFYRQIISTHEISVQIWPK
jgi:hypothetical protein